MVGRDTIVTTVLGLFTGRVDTTHQVTNPRISLDGDTARLTALVEAQHLLTADRGTFALLKNPYAVDLCTRRRPLADPAAAHRQRLVHRRPRRDLRRLAIPKSSGRKPCTYLMLVPGETAADAFAPDTLARLRAIKRRRDPHHTIRTTRSAPHDPQQPPRHNKARHNKEG